MTRLQDISKIALLMEGDQFRENVDGPPLQPTTIHGAEHQLEQLAQNIEYTFGKDAQFSDYRESIVKAVEYIRMAARTIGPEAMGDLRTARHKFTRHDTPGL